MTPRRRTPVPLLALVAAMAMVATAAPVLFGTTVVRAEGPAFIEALGDVPLMPGLRLLEESGLVFDAPAGRIVEAVAVGPPAMAAVRRFYRETLPQLGWQSAAGKFLRESEALRLEISRQGGETVVRFFLSPAQ